MAITITSDFEGGNIEVLSIDGASARLAIRPDAPGPWRQWFFFKVHDAAGLQLELHICNAGETTYPDGWSGYRACVSVDGEVWTRAHTTYSEGVLRIRHVSSGPVLWVAYFAPYGLARTHELLHRALAMPGVTPLALGASFEGRAIEGVQIGAGPIPIWLIGRQHAGESMASWWMEGALLRLLDAKDQVASALRRAARIHLVPIVNVDGVARGHLRGSATGVDLNRQWHDPDPVTAPEVATILKAMDANGCAFCLDVHGDETIPHVFIDGCDVDPAATQSQIEGVNAFRQALLGEDPAFQTKVGYPATYAGDEAAGMCSRALARRFGGLGITLEMPFKDSLDHPDPIAGWSPDACRRLARGCLAALESMVGLLA